MSDMRFQSWNVVHLWGLEGSIFSYSHCPTPQKVPLCFRAGHISSCRYLGLEGKLSQKHPNLTPVRVFSGLALGLQVNDSHPQRWQKPGIAEDLSKVPGSL